MKKCSKGRDQLIETIGTLKNYLIALREKDDNNVYLQNCLQERNELKNLMEELKKNNNKTDKADLEQEKLEAIVKKLKSNIKDHNNKMIMETSPSYVSDQ